MNQSAKIPKGEPKVEICSCATQEFTDGTMELKPCIPHALQQVGACLQGAGGFEAVNPKGHSAEDLLKHAGALLCACGLYELEKIQKHRDHVAQQQELMKAMQQLNDLGGKKGPMKDYGR